jgi:hypothetical protein
MTPPEPKSGWLYEKEQPPPAPPYFAPKEPELGNAWQRLQILHTPTRTIDPDEYRWIVDWLSSLERLFLENPELEPYYLECFAPERDAVSARGADVPERRVDHVATIQAQFMEEVFYILNLDRHANAPDNRGWMNLFRRWGRSSRFNRRLDELRAILTLEFLSFYDYYLRDYQKRIDEEPVPHPWDVETRRADPRAPGTIPAKTGGRTALEPGEKDAPTPGAPQPLPGIYLDPGLREAGRRHGERPVEQPGSARRGAEEHGRSPDSTPPDLPKGEPGGSAPDVPNK